VSLLFPPLLSPEDRAAVNVGGTTVTSRELAAAAGAVACKLAGTRRVAVVAMPTLETIVAVVGALAAGAAVVPINPVVGCTGGRAHRGGQLS
jgi:malonyl-CoA/methylmalonyl-CoA synthetase